MPSLQPSSQPFIGFFKVDNYYLNFKALVKTKKLKIMIQNLFNDIIIQIFKIVIIPIIIIIN